MAQDLLANYKAKHQHPLNRLTHSVGIPLIVVSLPLFIFNWRWALLLVMLLTPSVPLPTFTSSTVADGALVRSDWPPKAADDVAR